MMDLGTIRNYISLGYVTYNQVSIRKKKSLYTLIIANETSLGNIRWVYQEIELMTLDLEDHYKTLVLDIMDIKHNIILGILW
jgi:hypothetical protein